MPDEFSHKSIIKAQYAQNTERFVVFANVLVPPFSTRWHQLSKDGWNVIPTSGGTEYFKEFVVATTTPQEWIASIDSLNRLLLAYFIAEFAPRKIHSFELPHHLIEKLPGLLWVFGSDQSEFFNAHKHQLSFEMSGDIFNGLISNDPHYQTDISLINEWYEVFNNKVLFNCINLVKESFILINRQFSNVGFSNYTDLAMGIISLVSALEGLFTNEQDNKADINFKFKIVGSLYYQKYVTAEFLERFDGGNNNEKFTESQFREILSSLYDLRSDVAHGSYKKIFKSKHWRKLFTQLRVHYDDKFDRVTLSKQAALALGLLQKHLFALIIQSKTNLAKGIKIIEEIKI